MKQKETTNRKSKNNSTQPKEVLLRLRISNEAHVVLVRTSKANDRSISGQARNLIHAALGINPALS